MTSLMEQPLDADRMIGVCNAADPVGLHPKLVRLSSGWPVMVLPLPAGLAGRGTRPVTLYTPDGPQERMLGTPMVVEVGGLGRWRHRSRRRPARAWAFGCRRWRWR